MATILFKGCVGVGVGRGGGGGGGVNSKVSKRQNKTAPDVLLQTLKYVLFEYENHCSVWSLSKICYGVSLRWFFFIAESESAAINLKCFISRCQNATKQNGHRTYCFKLSNISQVDHQK